ncbi:hypothetical protein BURPSPAST_Y0112 [Burkholderia pseudomallei Pasteur 52237]|nr:hypothetical protein BURPSPAST_Y0112 [Burkholderia pseudomallei Pasteur 52237]
MDWARDYLGNDVPAWLGGMSGFGLTCPSCGEPVRRRAGAERRPHFAHYSHRAKPECENYFPSQGSLMATGPEAGVRVPRSRWKRESLGCGLFLTAEPGRTSQTLWLRIPPMDPETISAGRLELQSGLGHRTYDLADLSVARLVPMAPQVPLAVVVGVGSMLPVAAHIARQIGAFVADRNFFYAEEKGGRFVFSDEPLELGCRYRLLSIDDVVPPLDLGAALNWRPEGKFGGWNSYAMALPSSFFVGAQRNLLREIAEFLGRGIRSSRPRIYVVDPLPHHVEVDGTCIYPEFPESLLLRRTGICTVDVTASGGTPVPRVIEQSDEWVRLEEFGPGEQEFTVAVDGDEQMIIRTEDCPLFRPGGIAISTDDVTWDLCTDPPLAGSELLRHEVTIDCGNDRIAMHIAHLNDGWVLEKTQLSSPAGSPKNLFAGGFGELRAIVQTSLQEPEERVGESAAIQQLGAARNWLEHMVARSFGADGARRVRSYLADPTPANLRRLGPIMASRLMPYIRAAQHQHQEWTEGN